MGHRPSSFQKDDFKSGIRGYRNMFASVHLKEKELKKLWVEFGKIDKDGGRTVSACRVSACCRLVAADVVSMRTLTFKPLGGVCSWYAKLSKFFTEFGKIYMYKEGEDDGRTVRIACRRLIDVFAVGMYFDVYEPSTVYIVSTVAREKCTVRFMSMILHSKTLTYVCVCSFFTLVYHRHPAHPVS